MDFFFPLLISRPVIFTLKVSSEIISDQQGRFLHSLEMLGVFPMAKKM